MVNQVQVNSLVIGYSFKYTDKIVFQCDIAHESLDWFPSFIFCFRVYAD